MEMKCVENGKWVYLYGRWSTASKHTGGHSCKHSVPELPKALGIAQPPSLPHNVEKSQHGTAKNETLYYLVVFDKTAWRSMHSIVMRNCNTDA